MSPSLKLCNPVDNMDMEGTVSQNSDLGPRKNTDLHEYRKAAPNHRIVEP